MCSGGMQSPLLVTRRLHTDFTLPKNHCQQSLWETGGPQALPLPCSEVKLKDCSINLLSNPSKVCVPFRTPEQHTHKMPAVLLVELSPSLLPQGRAQEPKATLSNENKPLTFPRHTSQQLISPSALDCFKLYLFKTYKYKPGQ